MSRISEDILAGLKEVDFGKRDRAGNTIRLGDILEGELWSDKLDDYVKAEAEVTWDENECRFCPSLVREFPGVEWPEWDDIEGYFLIKKA